MDDFDSFMDVYDGCVCYDDMDGWGDGTPMSQFTQGPNGAKRANVNQRASQSTTDVDWEHQIV